MRLTLLQNDWNGCDDNMQLRLGARHLLESPHRNLCRTTLFLFLLSLWQISLRILVWLSSIFQHRDLSSRIRPSQILLQLVQHQKYGIGWALSDWVLKQHRQNRNWRQCSYTRSWKRHNTIIHEGRTVDQLTIAIFIGGWPSWHGQV